MHDPRKLADRHQGKYLGHILIPSYCSSKLRQNELAWLDIYSDIQFQEIMFKSNESGFCINNSPRLERKYAEYFSADYLFQEGNSFLRAQLDENCERYVTIVQIFWKQAQFSKLGSFTRIFLSFSREYSATWRVQTHP